MKTYAFIKDQRLVIIYASSKDCAAKIISKELKQWIDQDEISRISEAIITDGLLTIKK